MRDRNDLLSLSASSFRSVGDFPAFVEHIFRFIDWRICCHMVYRELRVSISSLSLSLCLILSPYGSWALNAKKKYNDRKTAFLFMEKGRGLGEDFAIPREGGSGKRGRP